MEMSEAGKYQLAGTDVFGQPRVGESPIGQGLAAQRQAKHVRLSESIGYLECRVDRLKALRDQITGNGRVEVPESANKLVDSPCLMDALDHSPDKILDLGNQIDSLVTDLREILF